MSFPKFVYMTKNTLFPILHVFAPLNDVRAYSAWSWKTTLITWIFGRAWYPLDIRVPPPPRVVGMRRETPKNVFKQKKLITSRNVNVRSCICFLVIFLEKLFCVQISLPSYRFPVSYFCHRYWFIAFRLELIFELCIFTYIFIINRKLNCAPKISYDLLAFTIWSFDPVKQCSNDTYLA